MGSGFKRGLPRGEQQKSRASQVLAREALNNANQPARHGGRFAGNEKSHGRAHLLIKILCALFVNAFSPPKKASCIDMDKCP
jgi:hypothetical protein